MAETPQFEIVAHVDGSCRPVLPRGEVRMMGAGIVLECGGRTKTVQRYLGQGTNQRAELLAAIVAMEEIGEAVRPLAAMEIVTDSRYVQGLLSREHAPKANRDLVAKAIGLAGEFATFSVRWVAGHSGVAGNERADRLASAAIDAYLAERQVHGEGAGQEAGKNG